MKKDGSRASAKSLLTRGATSRADQVMELLHRHTEAMQTVNPFMLPGMNRKERRKLAKQLKDVK